MANKFMAQLQKLEGAVVGNQNPFLDVIGMPTPSLGFIFGGTWGIPRGFSAILYGPPKSGKSLVATATIGQLHKDDPEAIVVKYNTELRETGQTTTKQAQAFGIDQDRYIGFDVNSPDLIFDKIETDIAALCDSGAPIKLIIIDSLTNIVGRRTMNADTVMVQQMGDDAMTIQVGLKRILPVLRKHKIALIGTAHVRAEMDPAKIMRGQKYRMAAAWASQHFFEYFVWVEANTTKEGRKDALGNEMIDENLTDMMDKGEKTGHKIRVRMEDSSMGPKGRTGEFTLDYNKGIVSKHEEVFELGVGRGVIEKPNQVSYKFGEDTFRGREAILMAIRDNQDLYNNIFKAVRAKDIETVL